MKDFLQSVNTFAFIGFCIFVFTDHLPTDDFLKKQSIPYIRKLELNNANLSSKSATELLLEGMEKKNILSPDLSKVKIERYWLFKKVTYNLNFTPITIGYGYLDSLHVSN